jgi:predicted nucleic acid-binding Zn ribbon protein
MSDSKKPRRLGDYDIWYKPCENCGYDTAKSREFKDTPRCWRCGGRIRRDFSERALKKIVER